jgi:hypothetical protein
LRHVAYLPSPSLLCSLNREKQEFRSIPGATYSTLLVNGTEEWDGSIIRCLVYTTGGGTFTNNFTIVISEAIPSSTYALSHTCAHAQGN